MEPPAALASDKQRRLCLAPDHRGCATYIAAQDARLARFPTADPARPFARTAPLVIDGSSRLQAGPLGQGRRLGQVGLVFLMVVAFAAVIVARSGQAPASSASGSPSGSAGASAESSPVTTPTTAEPSTPVPTTAPATPTATVAPSPSATVAPPAGSGRTYRVRSGDTLVGIAARFGTTVRAIAELNGIADPRLLRAGQVLQLP